MNYKDYGKCFNIKVGDLVTANAKGYTKALAGSAKNNVVGVATSTSNNTVTVNMGGWSSGKTYTEQEKKQPLPRTKVGTVLISNHFGKKNVVGGHYLFTLWTTLKNSYPKHYKLSIYFNVYDNQVDYKKLSNYVFKHTVLNLNRTSISYERLNEKMIRVGLRKFPFPKNFNISSHYVFDFNFAYNEDLNIIANEINPRLEKLKGVIEKDKFFKFVVKKGKLIKALEKGFGFIFAEAL